MKSYYLKSFAVMMLFLSIVVCCFPGRTEAAESNANQRGTLNIHVDSDANGIVMELYEVAEEQEGVYEFTPEFAQSGADLTSLGTSEKVQQTAEILQLYAQSAFLEGKTAKIDESGNARFTGVSLHKLYLVVQSAVQDQDITFRIQPLLACVSKEEEKSGSWEQTLEAKFAVERFSAVILNKTNSDGQALQGAVFLFQKKQYELAESEALSDAKWERDEGGAYYWKTMSEALTTNSFGQIVIEALPYGTYRFVETKAPEGYVLDDTPYEFTVETAGTLQLDQGIYKKDSGAIAELTVVNEKIPEPAPITPTSDPTDILQYLLLLIVAGWGTGLIAWRKFFHS